jgi:hypothetical protein
MIILLFLFLCAIMDLTNNFQKEDDMEKDQAIEILELSPLWKDLTPEEKENEITRIMRSNSNNESEQKIIRLPFFFEGLRRGRFIA